MFENFQNPSVVCCEMNMPRTIEWSIEDFNIFVFCMCVSEKNKKFKTFFFPFASITRYLYVLQTNIFEVTETNNLFTLRKRKRRVDKGFRKYTFWRLVVIPGE